MLATYPAVSRRVLQRLSTVGGALIATAALSLAQQRPEIHCRHFFYGYPFGTPETNDLIIREGYALSSNDDTKFADWVAYRIDPTMIADVTDPERKWRSDPWLDPDETLEKEDYTGASDALNTDRGHQAPLASFKSTLFSRSTNYLSNITPQQKALNQGPWKNLEAAVRDVVRGNRIVWVMTGPLFETAMDELPQADEDHTVPSGYWKIVAVGDRGNPGGVRATAFIMGQETPRDAVFTDSIVRINAIEQRSGLDFFWDMPSHIESQLENMLGTWPPVAAN